MKCYLVRHGQTSWNETHRFQGWLDIGLDTIGMLQAKMLADYFKQEDIKHIYSSDLTRALKTAQLIQQKTDCPLTISKNLRELNVGNWEGMTLDEITSEFKSDDPIDETTLFGKGRSGGESLEEFQTRIVECFHKIIEKHQNQDMIIVTHGGVVRVLLCHILGCDISQKNTLKIDNGSISILEINESREISIKEQNVTKHLST
ncbi:MAG: histidine phosphatase family protein [Acholeplasmataceae bacterium]|nr:histidine phosphatase family protein [Acholeplasmataceae bacterium]